MQDSNHTEEIVDTPLDDEELEASTSDDAIEESVTTFDDDLESAETDEDFAKLGEAARGEVEDPTAEESEEPNEEAVADEVDTKIDEPSNFNIGNGFSIKDGDIELNITDEAKLRQLAQMGLNYGGKTTELAKHRSFVKYAEDNQISLDDIQMLKDIKSGNKDAYSALGVNSKIDVYDIKEEHAYAPEAVVLPQQIDPMVDQIATEILGNEDHTSQFQKWVNPERMPAEVVQQIQTDANALRAVQADIESGIFDKAMNQAYSDVRVNGAEFNSAYLRAKEMLIGTKSPEAPKAPTITRGERQRASANRGKASSQKTFGSVSDMSNDDFLRDFDDIINGLERPQ